MYFGNAALDAETCRIDSTSNSSLSMYSQVIRNLRCWESFSLFVSFDIPPNAFDQCNAGLVRDFSELGRFGERDSRKRT